MKVTLGPALLFGSVLLLAFATGLVYGAWLFSVPETPSFVEGAMNG